MLPGIADGQRDRAVGQARNGKKAIRSGEVTAADLINAGGFRVIEPQKSQALATDEAGECTESNANLGLEGADEVLSKPRTVTGTNVLASRTTRLFWSALVTAALVEPAVGLKVSILARLPVSFFEQPVQASAAVRQRELYRASSDLLIRRTINFHEPDASSLFRGVSAGFNSGFLVKTTPPKSFRLLARPKPATPSSRGRNAPRSRHFRVARVHGTLALRLGATKFRRPLFRPSAPRPSSNGQTFPSPAPPGLVLRKDRRRGRRWLSRCPT